MFLIVISIEIINISNYIYIIKSLLKISIKASTLILNKNISDHWKEKIIPQYSYKIFKLSLSILLIFLGIFGLFYFIGLLFTDFFNLILSTLGILASILFSLLYVYLKNIFKK